MKLTLECFTMIVQYFDDEYDDDGDYDDDFDIRNAAGDFS